MSQEKLVMQISLNVLEHLGINLYSNVPAVLSEIVANAWDADATEVKITFDKESDIITITDNGIGMNRSDVIERYLMVGFQRRKILNEKTAKGRYPMGRKGIGKLSIFSIAQKAKIFTTKGEEKTAFLMDREAIRKAVENNDTDKYQPKELSTDGDAWPETLTQGTEIRLSYLDKNSTQMTINSLKSRVARRFSIIGKDFKVVVNDEEVTPADRGYHKSIQYLWAYNPDNDFIERCTNLERKMEERIDVIDEILEEKDISISGWIGTVKNPRLLKNDDGENLNNIAIFMRGKLAQEDILDSFGMKEIVADYVVGEIHCDDLDNDNQQDIATSSRQDLRQDDVRYSAVRDIIHQELRHIANRWSNWRREDGVKKAVKIPEVLRYLDGLKGATKKKAEKWIGRLNTMRSDENDHQKALLKGSILAFENYRHREALDELEEIKDEGVEAIISIFQDVNDLEQSYYGQIAQARVKVIQGLQEKVVKDVLEKVLQKYVFDHLWLLDPSWERAKGKSFIEQKVKDYFEGKYESKLSQEEKDGRIDIGYRTAVGKHVIIEMKRSSVNISIYDLTKQIAKYRRGVLKIIEGAEPRPAPLEIICLLGAYPREWSEDPELVLRMLDSHNARVLIYDELLHNANEAYSEYLDYHKKIDKLWNIFQAIDDFKFDT